MGMGFRITPYDDSLFSDKTGTLPSASEKEYLLNKTKAGVIFFKDMQDPFNGWGTPFVTGHKYKIHWG